MLDLDPDREPVTPRDAATVILLRESDAGVEVFLVRRHQKSGFMAGAYVFPGGVLDDADAREPTLARLAGRTAAQAAQALGEDDPTRALALHVAAARETFEEAAVLLARGVDAAADLDDARRRLNEGAAFDAILDELGATLAADALAPWARWVTPVVERRRYDARFFLARAPESQRASHDRVETIAGEWLTPDGALSRFEAGQIQLPPPTLRTLEELAPLDSVDAAFARAASRVPRPVQPHLVDAGGAPALTLPGDPAHPIAERRIDGPSRFVLVDGRFVSRDPD